MAFNYLSRSSETESPKIPKSINKTGYFTDIYNENLHNEAAELSILGALYYRASLLAKITVDLQPADFYFVQCRELYAAFQALVRRNVEVDDIILKAQLRRQIPDNEYFEQFNSFLLKLHSYVPYQQEIDEYARIIKRLSIRRQLQALATKLLTLTVDLQIDEYHILDTIHKELLAISTGDAQDNIKPIIEVTDTYLQNLKNRLLSPTLTGLCTGFEPLDELTGGFQRGDFIVIGARPSIGKTAIALNMATQIAQNGHKVAFFSLEMGAESIAMRLIAHIAQIPAKKLQKFQLNIAEVDNISTTCITQLQDIVFFIDDNTNLSLFTLISTLRLLKTKHTIDIVFIDYLSLINPESNRANRQEQFAAISKALKMTARELNIAIVALSQLTRDTEGREPTLANLRETGALEQDADLVLLLHRDKVYEPTEVLEATLFVAKHRNGPIGKIELTFNPNFFKFTSTNSQPPMGD